MARRNSDLLAEIERDVLDESKSVAAALRNCLALGGHARSAELRDWAERCAGMGAGAARSGHAGPGQFGSPRGSSCRCTMPAILAAQWLPRERIHPSGQISGRPVANRSTLAQVRAISVGFSASTTGGYFLIGDRGTCETDKARMAR